MSDTKESIGEVLGRLPSGVFIVTAGNGDGNTTGLLASWIQQASFEPPMVSIAINNSRYLNEWIKAHPQVVINIVAETDKTLFRHFGKGFEPDEEAFTDIETTTGDSGLPRLNVAVGWLEASVKDTVSAGDHTVAVAEVTAAGRGNAFEDKPFVHIRKNGFSY